jgi:hypothetical protein
MRQALAGMLWSKQYFGFHLNMWLKEHEVDPTRPGSRSMRNSEWFHMVNEHVISMVALASPTLKRGIALNFSLLGHGTVLRMPFG